jgi:pimeloyl-ACP methyl ester carboxylesterase
MTPGQGGTAVTPGTAERRSAWHRLAEVTVPVTVAGGDLDVPFIVDRCRQFADRLPVARHFVLAGLAHQPMSCPQNVRFWATLLMALHPRRGRDCIYSPEHPFQRLARIS